MEKDLWNEKEIKNLLDNYKTNDVYELSYILKTKNIKQIYLKLSRMKLNCKKVSRQEYHDLNEVFKDYKRLLNNEIQKMKKDYIIEYDILLFKYYLRKNDIQATKEFIYNMHFSNFLKQAKLYSRIKKKWHSCFEFVSMCFPQMNLKEYNFNTLQVREGFWNKDYNCFDMIHSGINKALKDFTIKSPSEILLFNLDNIYKYFHKSMIYYRGVGILEKYLNYKNIKVSNIRIVDNMRFDSNEELSLYRYLKANYNIIKNNKIFFKNKNVKYKPDFFINYNQNNIIVEYFGLYKEKPNNIVYIKYKEKTIEKIKYFSNLDNYKFIAIYPKDLKSGFKGVRNKLTSFFMLNFNVDINNVKEGEKVGKTIFECTSTI